MSVCSASASFLPTLCRGFTPCNPNFIVMGDSVTIDLCVENAAERPTAGDPPYPLVTAAIDAAAQIEVWLMCRETECSSGQLTGSLTVTAFGSNHEPPPTISGLCMPFSCRPLSHDTRAFDSSRLAV